MFKKFSLPLEYDKLSDFFDDHNVSQETELKNKAIFEILAKNNVKNIIDFTCGTGSQVFYLKNLGFAIKGIDISKKLIKIAQKKAKKMNFDENLFDFGDIRKSQIGKFDAAISMFNAIGHLSKKDFCKALKNISKNLKKDGFYLFDIFNLNALNEEKIHNFDMNISKKIVKNEKNLNFNNIQYSTLDKKSGILTSYDFYVFQENGKRPKSIKNKFSLQIYNLQEIKEILAKNNFQIAQVFDIFGNDFDEENHENMLILAKKL